MMSEIKFNILPGGIGQYVTGADLRNPLRPEDVEAIATAFDRWGLLIVPGQSLTHDQQARVMGYLGPTINPKLEPDSYITNREGPWGGLVDTGELCFHSDYAFFEEPPQALSLHAVQIIDHGSTTRFACSRSALRDLSPDMRALAEKVNCRHIFPASVRRLDNDAEIPIERPSWTRPLVLRDPRSGAPYLYLSHMMIDSIPELSAAESESLVEAVHVALTAPANIYEHSWRQGDLVIWNNMTFQHARGDVSAVGPRVLQKAYTMREPTMPRYPKAMRDSFEAAHREGRQGYDDTGRSVGIG